MARGIRDSGCAYIVRCVSRSTTAQLVGTVTTYLYIKYSCVYFFHVIRAYNSVFLYIIFLCHLCLLI